MPELAEVEYYRKVWAPACGERVLSVAIDPTARVFRGTNTDLLARYLPGADFLSALARGKNLLFLFSTGSLGLHLGMTGALSVRPPDHASQRHEHLVVHLTTQSLVFTDPRRFGRVRFEAGAGLPMWWNNLPPAPMEAGFLVAQVKAAAQRFRRTPLKAFLLKQEIFPGIGNWMADEILWRLRLHPARLTGSCPPETWPRLWRETRRVCRAALRTIGVDWSDPPASWLFLHRWKPGGHCPQCGEILSREEIGGRTTCWCSQCQPATVPEIAPEIATAPATAEAAVAPAKP